MQSNQILTCRSILADASPRYYQQIAREELRADGVTVEPCPRNWSGDAHRIVVAVVPACNNCNTLINDTHAVSITERRNIAHFRIRRANRQLLKGRDWSKGDLDELGPRLRGFVVEQQAKKRSLLTRLEWPLDPFYDLRAFQKSGIPDPVAIGMLDA